MKETSEIENKKNKRFSNLYAILHTNGKHQTRLDGATIDELYNILYKKILNNTSLRIPAQAIHNIYAKKIGVSPVKVVLSDDIPENGIALFDPYYDFEGKKQAAILYSENLGEIGPVDVFLSIIHETKHLEQYYKIHNYIKFGVVPHDDLGKLILMYKYFWNYGYSGAYELPYYSIFCEIDAHLYEVQEMIKLNNRYESINGYAFYWAIYYEKFSRILEHFNYNKEELDNKKLKQVYKALKRDLYAALQGYFGEEMQKLCLNVYEKGLDKQFVKKVHNNGDTLFTHLKKCNNKTRRMLIKKIYNEGFDLDSAFKTIINTLNSMHERTVLLAHTIRDFGRKAKFEENGRLLYSTKGKTLINPYKLSRSLANTFVNLSNENDDVFFPPK